MNIIYSFSLSSMYSIILTHKSSSVKICRFSSKRFIQKFRLQLHFHFNYSNCRFFRSFFNNYNRSERSFFFSNSYASLWSSNSIQFFKKIHQTSLLSNFNQNSLSSRFCSIDAVDRIKIRQIFKSFYRSKQKKKLMKRKWIIRWKNENKFKKERY